MPTLGKTMTGVIFDIQHGCLTDGDGIRTTIFLKGCPLRCKWCHNPESQYRATELLFYDFKCTSCGRCLADCPARLRENDRIVLHRESCVHCGKCVERCPMEANSLCGKVVTVEEVLTEAMEDLPFYRNGGGITLSGGEPDMQPNFALSLLEGAVTRNIDVAMETCGYGEREFFLRAAKLGCTFLFDLKELDSTTHKALTGVGNEKILANLEALFAAGAEVVLRLPLIPGANDSEAEYERLQAFLTLHRGQYLRAEIIPYHRLGKSKEQALGIDGVDYDASVARNRAQALAAMLGENVRVL